MQKNTPEITEPRLPRIDKMKGYGVILFGAFVVAAVLSIAAGIAHGASSLPVNLIQKNQLIVPQCSAGTTEIPSFILDDGTGFPIQQTDVKLCYDDEYIRAHYTSYDTNIVSNFTTCNQPLYTEDVVEWFISFGAAFPFRYIEMEVSPKGVLFVAIIDNYSLDCQNFTNTKQDCASTGIQWSAEISGAGWTADIAIPFAFLKSALGASDDVDLSVFRSNFYRIDQPISDREYSCWIPTQAVPACFHKPLFFGEITLK